jgi:hypothetical protein
MSGKAMRFVIGKKARSGRGSIYFEIDDLIQIAFITQARPVTSRFI